MTDTSLLFFQSLWNLRYLVPFHPQTDEEPVRRDRRGRPIGEDSNSNSEEPPHRKKRLTRENSTDSGITAVKSLSFDEDDEMTQDGESVIGPTTRRQWSEIISKSPSSSAKENQEVRGLSWVSI